MAVQDRPTFEARLRALITEAIAESWETEWTWDGEDSVPEMQLNAEQATAKIIRGVLAMEEVSIGIADVAARDFVTREGE